MENPWKATQDEIKEWAYDQDAEHPVQDWDIVVVARLENAQLLLDLASDENCPQKRWALVNLYFIVGDAIRTEGRSYNIEELKKFLDIASKIELPSIEKWARRSLDLIDHPEKFDYKAWCLGYLPAELVEYKLD